MIEAANAAINGNLEEEKLIANSKQVAVSVKQLVVASNVRVRLPPTLPLLPPFLAWSRLSL